MLQMTHNPSLLDNVFVLVVHIMTVWEYELCQCVQWKLTNTISLSLSHTPLSPKDSVGCAVEVRHLAGTVKLILTF